MVEEEDIAATSEQEFWPLGEQGEGCSKCSAQLWDWEHI
jgi:hypothetical protein